MEKEIEKILTDFSGQTFSSSEESLAWLRDRLFAFGNLMSGKKIVNYSEEFEAFWKEYPRKIAKKNAAKAWSRIKFDDKTTFEMVLGAMIIQRGSLQWQNPQYIPHPATWLNGERWNDEVNSSSKTGDKYQGL